MTQFKIKFLKEAEDEFKRLDNNLFIKVSKVLTKISKDPFTYSDPLGQKMNINLSGLRKAYVDDKRVRIVFMVLEGRLLVLVISINKRDKGKVYHLTKDRIEAYQSLFEKLKDPTHNLSYFFKDLS